MSEKIEKIICTFIMVFLVIILTVFIIFMIKF